jgi:small conductance mechanosensitive channel
MAYIPSSIHVLLFALICLCAIKIAPRFIPKQLPVAIHALIVNSIWIALILIAVSYTLDAIGLQEAGNISAAFILAISLILQGFITNFIYGEFILAEKSFAIGDVIVIGTDCGVVESIGSRLTVLKDINTGDTVYVQNSTIYSTTIRKKHVSSTQETK